MFPLSIKKTIKFPIILFTLGMLLFGFLCVGIFNKTPMQMSGMGAGTVDSQHKQPCCDLGASHQMDSWKSIILVTPERIRDTSVLLALVLTFLLYTTAFTHRSDLPDPDKVRLRLYIKENLNFILFNHLRLAFARGILNPKPY